jgi:hypothetical protein
MPNVEQYREDIGGNVSTRLDENGFLRVDGIAAQEGVMTYLQADGTVIKEYVPASTLEDAEALDMLTGSTVSVEHPGVLNADTATLHSRGSVSKAGVNDGKLNVGVVITSKEAIGVVQRGKRQLSPGYRAQLEMTPGEFNGIKYDAVQIKRTYNHLAIVDSARGGPECRLRLDAYRADGLNCAVEVPTTTTDEVNTMPAIKLKSGVTVEVADASTASTLQTELNQLAERADAASKMVEQSKHDELQGKYDALVAEMEKTKATKAEKMDADEIGSYIETVEAARQLKSDVEIKADGKYLDATAVMAAAMGIEAKDKSAEYIKGRFDSAVEMAGKDSIAKQRDVKQYVKDIPLTGREKFIADQKVRQIGGAK